MELKFTPNSGVGFLHTTGDAFYTCCQDIFPVLLQLVVLQRTVVTQVLAHCIVEPHTVGLSPLDHPIQTQSIPTLKRTNNYKTVM